ncbi:MAG: TlpA family protein disulfide reductase, partial [Gammaproteobacteria bacterium]|nr:TlpA family protein disulfide reductase [Gammaproteobacteria bacterium]
APCRRSLPQLSALREELADVFEVFAVNVDENPQDGIRFLEKYPVTYPVLADSAAKYPQIYQPKGMPTSYLVDKNGFIRHVHEGFRKGDIDRIRAMVEHLVKE